MPDPRPAWRLRIVGLAIAGLSIGILAVAFQTKPARPSPSKSSNPFGNTQLLTASASVVDGPGGVKNLKVEGIVSILAGQTLTGVKIELGTLKNGVFKASVPALEVTLHPELVDNYATWSHQFPKPALVSLSTYSVRVRALQRGPIVGQVPVYGTATAP